MKKLFCIGLWLACLAIITPTGFAQAKDSQSITLPDKALSLDASTTPQWVVDYSSYLGGGGLGWTQESGYAIATDAEGNIIVGGFTDRPDTFPFTWRFGQPDASRGAFITKIEPAGRRIIFSTFLAGAVLYGLAVDAQGCIYATGQGESFMPVTNAMQVQTAGGYESFAAKLSPDGSQLLYATFLGGSGDDLAFSIAVDNQGQAHVAGWTSSTNFPVTSNAVQAVMAGQRDAFLAVLNNTGSALVYATFLGGNQEDFASSLVLDKAGNAYLGGRTSSATFLANATPYRLGAGGLQNAFVAKLKPDGTALEYLTFMGGADSGSAVAALAVDATGHLYAFGDTDATNFPVTLNCWQSTNRGGSDNFLVKLNPAGSAFDYATYLGGSREENSANILYDLGRQVWFEKAGLAVDDLGNAYVAGRTTSSDLAPVGIAANVFSDGYDAYVAKINPTGSALLHLMYLGGCLEDTAFGITLDNEKRILVTGVVGASPDAPFFPVTLGALQTTNGGAWDAFVTRIREVQGPLDNDAFANRSAITGSRATVFANNSSASKEAGEPDHAGNPGGKSLWWSWQAPANGRLSVTTEGSSFDTLLAIYTHGVLTQLTTIATNDNISEAINTSQAAFPVLAGVEYQIAVDGQNGQSGTIILSLALSVPPNDDYVNRITVTNFPAILSGSNINATREPHDPMDRRDVWWQWIAPLSGPVAISTEGSSFDTILRVYTNSALSELSLMTWNDDDTNHTSRISMQAIAGIAYQIGVSGGIYDDGSGSIMLKIIPGAPPVNDNFTNSTWLPGAITNFTANNYGATREPDEINPGFDNAGGQTVWYSWKAPGDGRLTVSGEGSGFNLQFAVFTGTALTNLILVARNIPDAEFFSRRLNFAVQANTAYHIRVDGNLYGREGTFQLAYHYYHPFSITSRFLTRPTPAGFQFQGQGFPGASYGVEVSTNQLDWQLLPAMTLMGPSFDWRDTNAAQFPRRFYRLIEK